jgi:hypothetical protein
MVYVLSFLFLLTSHALAGHPSAAIAESTVHGPAHLKIDAIHDNKTMIGSGSTLGLEVGQTLGVKSQSGVGLIGFVRIKDIEKFSSNSRVVAEVIKISQYNLIRVGDTLEAFDLSSEIDDYKGSTELLVRQYAPNVSARFKPLFTQGILIGETAQTLSDNEFLFTWYGLFYYGLVDWMSIGTLAPADATNSPNFTAKIRFINNTTTSVATGVTLRKIPDGDRYTVNWNLMWDTFSSEKTVSHTFATLAIYSIEKAEDTTAIKSGGTSTFQTGYEVILDNWSVHFGPNYNFETKTVGGYLAYAKVWDHFNLQGTIYSTNIRNVQWSINDGYVVYLDAYWRF